MAATLSRLRADLQVRHQQSLEKGLRITLNEEQLAARPPTLLYSQALVPIRKQFDVAVNGERVNVDLLAGLVRGADEDRDEGSAEEFQRPGEAGWYLFCNGRLVFAAERTRLTGWGSVGAAYHPQYRNFRGYVLLVADNSALLPWNTTKTGVDEDSRVFRVVQSEMQNALRRVQSIINRLKQERRDRDPEDRPLDAAIAAATETPLRALPSSEAFVAPPTPPAPPAPRQRVVYDVDRERFDQVAEVLGVSAPGDVGRGTFDHYFRTQVQ
jgi:hypothetical protein